MSLLDIFLKENEFSSIILNSHDINTTNCISLTCKTFNKIVENDMKKHYNNTISTIISNRFENIVKRKMVYMCQFDSINDDIDELKEAVMEIEDCDEKLIKLSREITEENREKILTNMKDTYDEYLFNTKVLGGSTWRSGYEYMLQTYIMQEYVNFMKNVLGFNIENDQKSQEYNAFLGYI